MLAIPTILITGPVGVGKTTVASELSWMLEALHVPHGFIDTDAISVTYPPLPPHLTLRNLEAVWKNYQAAGATRLILTQVIYSRAELEGFRAAVPGAEITVFRLWARPDTLLSRVDARELGGLGQEIHRRQALELAVEMEEAAVEDHWVDTEGRSPKEVANEILRLSGWEAGPSN